MSLIKNNIKIEKNPFDLLEKWYKKAKKNEISNPNAMALSTVGPCLLYTSDAADE